MNKNILMVSALIILSAFLMSSCSEDDKTAAFNKIKSKLALQENKAAMIKPIFDEQIDKISAILEEAKNSRPEMKKGSRPSFQQGERPGSTEGGQGKIMDQLAAKLRPVNEDADSKLATILTIYQINEYDTIMDEFVQKLMEKNKPENKGGQMGGHGGGMGGPGGGMGGQGSGMQW
jgi:hypothetical protein